MNDIQGYLTDWQYFVRGCVRVIKWCLITLLVLLASNVIGYWLVRLDWVFVAEPHFDTYWKRAASLAATGLLHTAVVAGGLLIIGYFLHLLYVVLLYAGGYRDRESVELHPGATREGSPKD